MSRRNPMRCPYCHGTNNHSPGFDCRARHTLTETLEEMERTHPEVRKARENYDAMVRDILAKGKR